MTRGDPDLARLEARLRRETRGEVLFDPFSRGRYATDASIYQIEPLGVLVPKSRADVRAAIAIAREEGTPVLPRGAGTSQCGQSVARALVIDCSKYLNRVLEVDAEKRRARVEPGVVLDDLNRLLGKEGLFFPVDPSTASRATLGGMAANNSCGSRSLVYGTMVHNVRAIEALLADGTEARFAEVPQDLEGGASPRRYRDLVLKMHALASRERQEIERRFPKLASMGGKSVLLHGHCHQKAFGTVGAAVEALGLIPGLSVETSESTCCGMAGAFGYEAEHYEMSVAIGELGVLPKIRAAPKKTLIAANGVSCRHQIADLLGREVRHIVRILDEASAMSTGID